ncbi:MAG: 4Fe-4S binding protein [Nitrosomonadales bacterium]|nr:4Fe-4S binding protein [Nitrosomonadales bacterium]
MSASPQPRKVIPIKLVGAKKPPEPSHFHWKRRAVQIATLILAVLIPASGLFRIDPMAGAFVVLDRQIWLGDFFMIMGLWVSIVSLLVLVYSTVGTVFCGWVCPQNTLSEWANQLTRKMLGKRADMSLSSGSMVVAADKNKVLNWLILGGAFLVASLLLALIPLFYFYPPEMVWSFVTFQDDPNLARSLHWIYAFAVAITFLDIAMLRHFWCRFACIYRMWQHSFKTKQTLHVAYDATRAEDCAKCNYCVTSCFLDLDPRKTDVYSSCINCGECIDACDRLHAKQGEAGLLKFELGAREDKLSKLRDASYSLFSRVGWTTPFAIIGAVMFTWGLLTYDPYHVTVYRGDTAEGRNFQSYRIAVSNKMYHSAQFAVKVNGLPQGSYQLSEEAFELGPVGRESVTLSILPGMQHGLASFVVEVEAADGWVGRFPIQHFTK